MFSPKMEVFARRCHFNWRQCFADFIERTV
jgi:hypothetical protein